MIINEIELPNFSENEFPKGEIKNTDPKLFFAMQDQRNILGVTMRPSPVSGALARYKTRSETSCHYADDIKKSTACDWFPGKDLSLTRIYFDVTYSQLWGGIGFYFDGKGFSDTHDTRIHTDLRPLGQGHSRKITLLWFVTDGKRHYPQYDGFAAVKFFELLRENYKKWTLS